MILTRLKIVAIVWLATMFLAIPAGIVTWLLLLMSVDWSGSGRSNRVVPALLILGVPAMIAAGLTRLLAYYVARASANDIVAGPTILGCGAGLLLALAVFGDSSESVALPALLIMPVGGAFAGSLVELPATPMAVAGTVAGVALVAVMLGSL